MPKSVLNGTKVLEYSQMVAGPYCGKLLADLGAEVIKIEKPGNGDVARSKTPFFHDSRDSETSGLFLYLNTNKLSVTLDAKTQAGKEIFLKLVRQCDILIIDLSPQEMQAMGVQYESLKELNPGLIMTSITAFGQTGPYKDYKAYPLNVFQSGGEGYLTPGGLENMGRPPLKAAEYLGEYDSGLNAAVATLAAIYWKEATGEGQLIDISKQESVMAVNRFDMVRSAYDGAVINRGKQGAPYGGMLPCKNGEYTVFITWEPVQWQRLVAFMGHPDWADDEMFKDHSNRVKHGETLNALLTEWLSNHTREDLYHKGQAAGVPFGLVCNSKDLINSDHFKAREFFLEIDHPKTGTVKYPSVPYRFSNTPCKVQRPAPLLGEHNDQVYINHLSYSQDQLARLKKDGVI
jgi:crotonobetainyl-CoA:carnitine CoA-transferase CaiB-like acyl-CoA transferase